MFSYEKLSRRKLIVPRWNIKRCLQFRRNDAFFLFFDRMRKARMRVAKGGKLRSSEKLLYPNISWRRGKEWSNVKLTSLEFEQISTKMLKQISHRNERIEMWAKSIEKAFKNAPAFNRTRRAKGAPVTVLLRILYWTKNGLPVSPPHM